MRARRTVFVVGLVVAAVMAGNNNAQEDEMRENVKTFMRLKLKYAQRVLEGLTLENYDAIVIGIGPIGRQVASRLEIMGVDVCLLDLSPINLYAFAQQGFHTVAGDARDPQVLHPADTAHCGLAVVSVPGDEVANQIVRALRGLNATAAIVVRCRYQGNIDRAKKAGANTVISEEAEASGALLRWCERFVRFAPGPSGLDLADSKEEQ